MRGTVVDPHLSRLCWGTMPRVLLNIQHYGNAWTVHFLRDDCPTVGVVPGADGAGFGSAVPGAGDAGIGIFAGGVVCGDCIGGATCSACAGRCDTGGSTWTACAGTAGDVGAALASGICTEVGVDNTGGVDGAGGAV